MTPFVNLVAAISQLVLSVENLLSPETTIDAKDASIKCMKVRSKNSNSSIALFAILPLILENSDKETMKIDNLKEILITQ